MPRVKQKAKAVGPAYRTRLVHVLHGPWHAMHDRAGQGQGWTWTVSAGQVRRAQSATTCSQAAQQRARNKEKHRKGEEEVRSGLVPGSRPWSRVMEHDGSEQQATRRFGSMSPSTQRRRPLECPGLAFTPARARERSARRVWCVAVRCGLKEAPPLLRHTYNIPSCIARFYSAYSNIHPLC
jgi:hypothetical protein